MQIAWVLCLQAVGLLSARRPELDAWASPLLPGTPDAKPSSHGGALPEPGRDIEKRQEARNAKTRRAGWRYNPKVPSSLAFSPKKHEKEDEKNFVNCTLEREAVKAALQTLGVPEERMMDKRHCRWKGVLCGHRSHRCLVTAIRIFDGLRGQVPKLDGLKGLRLLSLANNRRLRGDLSTLRTLPQGMQFLNLRGTLVSGNLEALSGLANLKALWLADTGVSGKLEDLSSLCNLVSLALMRTQVAGNLSGLSAMTQISKLKLARTKVHGSLQELKLMSGLRELDLSEIGTVQGDLKDLEELKLLNELDLSKNADVTGELYSLLELGELREVRLRDTQVRGHLDSVLAGSLNHLRFLDLSGTQTNLSLESVTTFDYNCNLVELDVSRCPLNLTAWQLVSAAVGIRTLSRLSASGSNVGGWLYDGRARDGPSLQALDLSHNKLEYVMELVAGVFVNLAGNPPLTFSHGLLSTAQREGVRVDLTGVDFREARAEAQGLLESGAVRKTDQLAMVDKLKGFSCFNLKDGFLQANPELFLPRELCGCLPGWGGHGIDCSPCGHGFYSRLWNTSSCLPCPFGSNTTETGSRSWRSCQCEVGRTFNKSGTLVCECPAQTALLRQQCVDCDDLNLDCSETGRRAESAEPSRGHARLSPGAPNAWKCLELAEVRCNASAANRSELGCAPGYDGPLCTTCAKGFRTRGSRCQPCTEGSEAARWPAVAVLLAVAAAGAAFAWRRSSRMEEAPVATVAVTPQHALWPLLLAQGPVLLQLGQLWGVLVALSDNPSQLRSDESSGSGMWEQDYVQWLQFTASGLRDVLSLECAYGRTARSLSALCAPCLPLLVLLLCALVEAVSRGQGVSMMLKAMSLLFVGGASSCAKLLDCQLVDGGGVPLLGNAFRTQLPHKLCSESDGEAWWADLIGWVCAISYLCLIPSFLVYLLAKQYFVLSPNRRLTASVESQEDKITVHVQNVLRKAGDPPMKCQDSALLLTSHLAAAVSYVAVFLSSKGKVQLRQEDGALTLQQLSSAGEHEKELEFDANSILSSVLESKDSEDLQRWQAITRMLTERGIVEELEDSDRVLAGAKELFFKYAACQEVWVEIALKLVVVALVAASATYHSLEFTIGLTLGTAIVLGTKKPYRQRQVNDLQCFCFICLAVSALGFAWNFAWLARLSLVAPFVLAATQTLRPDGPEALALRLFEAAKAQRAKLTANEGLELAVEPLRFL